MWQGQTHATKQRMSMYSLAQVTSSRGNCLSCHVDSDLTSVPCHGTDVSPKDGKRPQGRTTKPQKSQSGQSSQRQNPSHSIVAGANRRQWGHILDDLQRRNVGKLHGSVRKGPPPYLATWKPEPRGYPTCHHNTHFECPGSFRIIPFLAGPSRCSATETSGECLLLYLTS